MDEHTLLLERTVAELVDIARSCLPDDGEECDALEGLQDLGFDSVSLITLIQRIDRRFGTAVDLEILVDCANLGEVARHLADRWSDRLLSFYGAGGR